MRVYRPQDADVPRHRLHVQPGREFPNSDWLDAQGAPRMFTVEFRAGCAEVPDNLGQYMIDKGMAAQSPLILPPGATLRGTTTANAG